MKVDTVVIGSGCSGTTAALLLAKQGQDVLLLEKQAHLSPLLRGFSRQGVHFDTGFHYTGGLGRGGPLQAFFHFLGLHKYLQPITLRAKGFEQYRFLDTGFTYTLPWGYERIYDTLATAFPGSVRIIKKYLEDMQSAVQSSPFLNLNAPMPEDFFALSAGPTLGARLQTFAQVPYLQSILSLPCLLYGTRPSEALFTHHAFVAGSYYQRAHTLVGGGRSLALAFEQALDEAGVQVECGKTVTDIRLTDGAVRGVLLDDAREIQCRQCLYTGHPGLLPELLPPGSLRPAQSRRLRENPETPAAFMLFGIAESPVPEFSGRHLFLCPHHESDNFLCPTSGVIYLAGAIPDFDGRQAFVAITSADKTQYAPWAQHPQNYRGKGYAAQKALQAEQLAETIFAGAPELTGRVQFVDAASPLTLRDWTGNPGAGMYGMQHSVREASPLPVSKIRGLFLAGQSILLPGVLGTVISAFVTCGLMTDMDRLRKELFQCIHDA